MNKAPWTPRSPFVSLPFVIGTSRDLIVTERYELGLATVLVRRGRHKALTQRVRERFDLELPRGPRRHAAAGVAFAGVGPESWLAMQHQGGNAFARLLRDSLGDVASVSDQSDAYALLRLTGTKVRETLAKLIPIDVHARTFKTDDVASTVTSHIGATLWRLKDTADGAPVFEIAVFRSYAESFVHSLIAD